MTQTYISIDMKIYTGSEEEPYTTGTVERQERWEKEELAFKNWIVSFQCKRNP